MVISSTRAALVATTLAVTATAAAADDVIYAPPDFDTVRSRTLDWVAAQDVADKAAQDVADKDVADKEDVLQAVGKLWAQANAPQTPEDLFQQVIETFSLVDPGTRAFVTECRLHDVSLLPPDDAVLRQAAADPFYRDNLGLFYARYLSRREMYDEALSVFEEIDVEQVVDPATYFFFKGVCEHALLMKEEGLESLKNLLENTEDVPVRYATVAELMQYDLQSLRPKTLDEVARKMSDAERRLSLGRGGQKVQKVEDEIVALLDELIKRLEQQGGGGGGGASGSGQNQSSSPAQDSVVKGTTAPGEVDEKDIGNESDWGSLPPKERARARNLLNRDFPSHYRQAIEQYFKKLANRRAP